MNKLPQKSTQIWKSAQMLIGFHRNKDGSQRQKSRFWSPKDGNATISTKPADQEAFVVVKSVVNREDKDVQIKFNPDKIVLRRDRGDGWHGVVVDDYSVTIVVGDKTIVVEHDGSVSSHDDHTKTWIEASGSIIKITDFVESSMSADGVTLTRRSEDMIASIQHDGVMAKAREKK